MISYKTIHQTDKIYNSDSWETKAWQELNRADKWRLNFLDDDAAFGLGHANVPRDSGGMGLALHAPRLFEGGFPAVSSSLGGGRGCIRMLT
jgi:hypothetical protein